MLVIRRIRQKCTWNQYGFFGASGLDKIDHRASITINNGYLSRAYSQNDTCPAGLREPPEARGLPLVGTSLSLMMAGGAPKLHEYVDKRHRQLGPIYREQIGPLRAIFVNSPDAFLRIFRLEGTTPRHFLPEAWLLYNNIRKQRRGLLFMDGEEWRQYRTILNKSLLLSSSVQLMSAPCQYAAENLTRKLRVQSNRGVAIENLEYQLYYWSIEVMMATLMGSQWQNCKQQMIVQVDYLALMLYRIFEYSAKLSMVPAKLAMRLKLPMWTKFVETADTILDTVRNMALVMMQLGGDGMLKFMMDNGILDDIAIRIIGDFIIAAGDTTAMTMQWVLFLLSNHPELQDQLYSDIKNLVPEEILKHNLLKNVIRETLRLHPIAPFLSRYLAADDSLGDYLVSKEDLLIMSIYTSSRDPLHFTEPNKFDPERWIRKDGNYQGVTNSYATLPFAIGVRSCIGRKLAETQLSLTLAQLIKTFKIDCENQNSIKMILRLICVPSEPIKLKLTERCI